jgi:hypothetical protein
MTLDRELARRIVACAATEGVAEPEAWVVAHKWELSAQPGWDAAYAYAIDSKNLHPGEDEGVITDANILTAVQALITAAAE